MAFLFQKFQEAVKVLAKSPTFAKDGRHLQFASDVNKLFLYTCYNRLGKNAEEADLDEIIDMGSKVSLEEQQQQVQANIHEQITTFCKHMDDILCPDPNMVNTHNSSSEAKRAPRRSGLGLAVGGTTPLDHPSAAVPETKQIKLSEVSQKLKDLLGYTLETKPSQIQHKDAGQGLFLDGEADAGAIIAIYPGITYSPAYYQYIPSYPRVDLNNPYLITRYDGTVINAQPWGTGGESRVMWDGSSAPRPGLKAEDGKSGSSDRMWKLLSKPLDGSKVGSKGVFLERRHPLALAQFANHPAKDMLPNVMVCSHDFPLTEQNMRTYIPNVPFGGGQEVSMKKFGTFWFKSWKSKSRVADVPIIKSLVLVATRGISDEEILLNYRLSNLKHRPSWYTPVDEEEDQRRWS